ncbi:MAG: hypothetical protein QXH08_03080 [Candidatus Hadarchaeales archaeon]
MASAKEESSIKEQIKQIEEGVRRAQRMIEENLLLLNSSDCQIFVPSPQDFKKELRALKSLEEKAELLGLRELVVSLKTTKSEFKKMLAQMGLNKDKIHEEGGGIEEGRGEGDKKDKEDATATLKAKWPLIVRDVGDELPVLLPLLLFSKPQSVSTSRKIAKIKLEMEGGGLHLPKGLLEKMTTTPGFLAKLGKKISEVFEDEKGGEEWEVVFVITPQPQS